MNIDNLLGSMMRSQRSSASRITRSLGGRAGLGGLAGMAGVDLGQRPLGGALGGLLGEAERAVGGRRNLAIGGLGALAGAMLGGRRPLRGALGGGAMALLGVMAYQALKARPGQATQVPLGFAAPQDKGQEDQLESNACLVARAMVNAAKADGEIDEEEMGRILARVDEDGTDAEARQYLETLMKQPMETAALVAAARGDPELGAQMYSASLLAIEVDTPAEKEYLRGLAAEMGLDAETVRRLHEIVGLPQP